MPFSINLPGSQHGEDDPAQNERRGAPLLGFFYELRRRRIAVGANEWLALYEARPQGGRPHQVRVHAAQLGVTGEPVHGR